MDEGGRRLQDDRRNVERKKWEAHGPDDDDDEDTRFAETAVEAVTEIGHARIDLDGNLDARLHMGGDVEWTSADELRAAADDIEEAKERARMNVEQAETRDVDLLPEDGHE